MATLFIKIYEFLSRRVKVFSVLLTLFLLFALYYILKLDFKEDVNSIIPRDERIDAISEVFSNSKLADRIIVTISLSDTSLVDRSILLEAGQQFFDSIQSDTALIAKIDYAVDQSKIMEVYDFIHSHLPLYLEEKDYQRMDSILNDSAIYKSIESGYRSLISPAGFATGKFFFKDPLNIASVALQRLSGFNIDDNFLVIDGHIFTKDQKKLMLFIDPYHPASNTKENEALVQLVKKTVQTVEKNLEQIKIESYGGTIVAIENSVQVKKDIMVTVSISLLFLSLLFWFYFRRIRIIFFLFIPVAIGTIVSLLLLSLIEGEISMISLGIGAILLCVAIDYSIHVFTHIKETQSVRGTLKKVSTPLMMSSLTTASALLCIYIIKSEALEQLSLFAAFAIFFSALSALIVLPLIAKKVKLRQESRTSKWVSSLVAPDFHKSKILAFLVIALSLFFALFIPKINFNGDISTLNFQSKEVSQAERNLRDISSEANSSVFAFTHGKNLNEALEKAESSAQFIESLLQEGYIKSSISVAEILPSRSAQKDKIAKWNSFWNNHKKQEVKEAVLSAGKSFRIKEVAFNQFFNLLDKNFEVEAPAHFEVVMDAFLSNYIHRAGEEFYVATILKSEVGTKPQLIDQLLTNPDWVVFDQQLFINKLLEVLKEDFNRLSTLSMFVVFGILLLFFGRIELATVTFLPIAVGWIWTLGIMGLFGIEFNIFNIIISSIIFGLGLDFSIFIVNGMIDDYKHGNTPLVHFKTSVFMSALTTLGGFGVLVFAKHPAIKSIASVAIIGIGSVLIITFVFTPMLFNFLIKNRKGKRLQPISLSNALLSVVTFFVFLMGALIMSLMLPILWILPLPKKWKKSTISFIICYFSKGIVSMIFPIRKRWIDKHKVDFSKPSVIISNHQSHLDLVLILMLHPKIIVFTNKWVYNNPFYGLIIRFADYYPAYRGVEAGFDKIKQKVADGYSILIFPEGKRTLDGQINRFHQGAFSVAHELGLDVQPIMIHGAYDCLPKTEFFLKTGRITLKFFDRITPKPQETSHGLTFRLQTKEVTAFYRKEYELLRQELETPDYFKNLLIHQYLYKGPVLEWYMKVKLKLEKNYRFYNDLIPLKANVVDVGCGYGFLAHMLRLVSSDRTVIGVDYDEEKIALANHLPVKDDNITFQVLDLSHETLPDGNVFVFNDVLHYLPKNRQMEVLNDCMAQLPDDGIIIVRDADADMKKGTWFTKFTEFQSTKLFKFNRADHPLTFVSGKMIKNLAAQNDFNCEVFDQSYLNTSNLTYVMKRN